MSGRLHREYSRVESGAILEQLTKYSSANSPQSPTLKTQCIRLYQTPPIHPILANHISSRPDLKTTSLPSTNRINSTLSSSLLSTPGFTTTNAFGTFSCPYPIVLAYAVRAGASTPTMAHSYGVVSALHIHDHRANENIHLIIAAPIPRLPFPLVLIIYSVPD